MNTGTLIRKLRSERKMSQQELADRAGVSFSFVNQVEGGKQTVRLDALNKLLTVFDYEMAPSPAVKTNSIQREEAQIPQQVETPSAFEEELPPVTIHKPKNDWSFY